jgi:hypothetical protein
MNIAGPASNNRMLMGSSSHPFCTVTTCSQFALAVVVFMVIPLL